MIERRVNNISVKMVKTCVWREKSNNNTIWSCCDHLYCESCYLDKAPKCDNCGKKSKRHLEDYDGVELELDEDEVYYCLACLEG